MGEYYGRSARESGSVEAVRRGVVVVCFVYVCLCFCSYLVCTSACLQITDAMGREGADIDKLLEEQVEACFFFFTRLFLSLFLKPSLVFIIYFFARLGAGSAKN